MEQRQLADERAARIEVMARKDRIYGDLARLVGLAGCLLHHRLHALREVRAVVQAGERITLREERELLLGRAGRPDIVERDQHG